MKIKSILLICVLILGLSIGLIIAELAEGKDHGTPSRTVEVIHRICTSIGGLGSFIALIILIRQFHLLQKQTSLVQNNIKASLDAQLYTRLDSFNRFVFEHHSEYDRLNMAYSPHEKSDENSKLHRMCELGYTIFEETFQHHERYGLLALEDWEKWVQNIRHFFRKKYVMGYWKSVSTRYAVRFQRFVATMIAEIEKESIAMNTEN